MIGQSERLTCPLPQYHAIKGSTQNILSEFSATKTENSQYSLFSIMLITLKYLITRNWKRGLKSFQHIISGAYGVKGHPEMKIFLCTIKK